MKRVTEQDSENYKNRILIIGCGSIGGHVICELAKAGYEDLTIVDYEKLTEENIFRHVLGMEYVNRYKCEALNTYIQKNIPEIKITTLAERIEDAITEEDINSIGQGFDLSKAKIIDPFTSELTSELQEKLYQLRKEKGMTEENSRFQLVDISKLGLNSNIKKFSYSFICGKGYSPPFGGE